MHRRPTGKLTEAARAAYFEEKDGAVFTAADYGLDSVEVWPENWQAWSLFCQVSTQWRIGMGGQTGLDYGAIYPLLDRIAADPAEWMDLFEDLQILERTALKQMSENRSDK